MKLELLDLAMGDLIEGYHFYELQEAGLGTYFLDTLCSDIDSPASLQNPFQESEMRS
jgi:hypothetical protein